jgi:hypothetical protein
MAKKSFSDIANLSPGGLVLNDGKAFLNAPGGA